MTSTPALLHGGPAECCSPMNRDLGQRSFSGIPASLKKADDKVSDPDLGGMVAWPGAGTQQTGPTACGKKGLSPFPQPGQGSALAHCTLSAGEKANSDSTAWHLGVSLCTRNRPHFYYKLGEAGPNCPVSPLCLVWPSLPL